MRKLFLLFVVNLIFCLTVFAVDTKEAKVAFLDTKKLLLHTKTMDKVKSTLFKSYADRRLDIDKKRDKLQNNIELYHKKTQVFKLQQLEEWLIKIREQHKELVEAGLEFNQEVDGSANIEFKKLSKYFANIVAQLSKKKDLDLVLFTDVILYSKSLQDITEEVIGEVTENE